MDQNLNTDIEGLIFDVPETLLTSQNNINVACFITHEACRKYYQVYNNRWIPLSFIEFYFDEYKRVDFMSPNFLEPFFELYSPDDVPAIVERYYNSHYSLIKRKSNRKNEICYYIEGEDYFDSNLSDPNVLGLYSPELYKNLNVISNHVEKSDELLTIRQIYENFMMKKIVLAESRKTGSTNKASVEQALHQDSDGTSPRVTKADTTLIGEKSNIPNLKGRVVKIYFPKLQLPSAYPVLLDSSRINSDHRARKFTSPAHQITLVNKHKFNAVKYKTGFIQKRKAAKKPKKQKFDFDF